MVLHVTSAWIQGHVLDLGTREKITEPGVFGLVRPVWQARQDKPGLWLSRKSSTKKKETRTDTKRHFFCWCWVSACCFMNGAWRNDLRTWRPGSEAEKRCESACGNHLTHKFRKGQPSIKPAQQKDFAMLGFCLFLHKWASENRFWDMGTSIRTRKALRISRWQPFCKAILLIFESTFWIKFAKLVLQILTEPVPSWQADKTSLDRDRPWPPWITLNPLAPCAGIAIRHIDILKSTGGGDTHGSIIGDPNTYL